MPSEITYYMNRVSELRRERDEARQQVQTLRAALTKAADTLRSLERFDFGGVPFVLQKDVDYLADRLDALAALEREKGK